jgi:molecular chaperone DnaK (HSP70)
VNLVLLAGGASRIPKLQAWLQGSFPESTPMRCADVNPEEAVAIGAAIQAQLLSQAGNSFPLLVSHPVTAPLPCSPVSFGILPSGDDDPQPVTLLPRGKLLPAEQEVRLSRAAAGQPNVFVRVVASPHRDLSGGDRTVIGEVQVGQPGDQGEVALLMRLSRAGILHLTVRSSAGEVLKEVVIRPHAKAPSVLSSPSEGAVQSGQAN